jgi:hypothetical protein
MERFKLRRQRRHEKKFVAASIAGLVLLAAIGWSSSRLLAEYKTTRYIVAVWYGTCMFGRSTTNWKYPGGAVYRTQLPNEWLPRVRQSTESEQFLIPLWPLVIPLLGVGLKPLWNRAILRAARDAERVPRGNPDPRGTAGASAPAA